MMNADEAMRSSRSGFDPTYYCRGIRFWTDSYQVASTAGHDVVGI